MYRILTNVPGLLTVFGIVAAWQLSCEFGLIRLTSIPTPWQIALGLITLGKEGRLLGPVVHTVGLVLAGSAIAIVLGTVIGAVLGLSSVAHRWMMASIDFFRSLPAVALLPMAVMFWGPTNTSEMVVIVYSATWIMAINAAGSIAAVNPRLGDVATTLRIGCLERLLKIWLPAATAGLLVGARLAVITAAITAIIAETLVNPRGLGWEIVSAQRAMSPVRLWSYAILAGIFGFLLNSILILAVRHLSPGGRANPALTGA